MSTKREDVRIAKIDVRGKRRSLNPGQVDKIAKSMSSIGLQTPITVRAVKKRIWGKIVTKYKLVAGLHRLEAAKKLGFEKISCVILESDKRLARLWQISENLHRTDLTALEYDEHVAEWVRLVEEKIEKEEADEDQEEGIIGQKVQKNSRGRPKGGIAAAARQLPLKGKSEDAKRKNVSRSIKVAGIAPNVKDVVKEAGLDQERGALLKIAAEKTPDAQLAKARELAARRVDGTTPDTLSMSDGQALEAALKLWKRSEVKRAFGKLSVPAKERFVASMRHHGRAGREKSGSKHQAAA